MTSESIWVTTKTINLISSIFRNENGAKIWLSSMNVEGDPTPKNISPFNPSIDNSTNNEKN